MAAELERRWNDRLVAVQQQKERLAGLAAAQPETLSAVKTDRLMTLGADLEAVWNHLGASAETRMRILRAVLEEIDVTLADGRIEFLLHWRGDHPQLSVRRNSTGQQRWSTDAEVGDLIRTLARQQADGVIAARQVRKRAPWIIPEARLADLDGIISAGGRPRTSDPNQKVFDLQ